jgi:hypothetical protein
MVIVLIREVALLEHHQTRKVAGHFSASAINRVMDVLENGSSCRSQSTMQQATPDQRQNALNELAAASVGLQHIRQARAVLVDGLQQEA